jgi:hypothetical protein
MESDMSTWMFRAQKDVKLLDSAAAYQERAKQTQTKKSSADDYEDHGIGRHSCLAHSDLARAFALENALQAMLRLGLPPASA